MGLCRVGPCFKCYLNKSAETLILERDEGNVSTLVKFKYQSSSSKNKWVFDKTNMISGVLFT